MARPVCMYGKGVCPIPTRLQQQLRSVSAPLNRFYVLWRHRNHRIIIIIVISGQHRRRTLLTKKINIYVQNMAEIRTAQCCNGVIISSTKFVTQWSIRPVKPSPPHPTFLGDYGARPHPLSNCFRHSGGGSSRPREGRRSGLPLYMLLIYVRCACT